MIVVDFLPTGRENAISMADLANCLGVTERTVRKHIEAERRNGKVICSSTDEGVSGYFLPADIDEVREFVKLSEKRIRTARQCTRSAKAMLREYERCDPNQLSLFDFVGGQL